MQADQKHWNPGQLLEWLQSHEIECPTITHAPLRTVEDSRLHREIAGGAYTKNLFVRNKKGRMWLITLLEDRTVHLKSAAKHFKAGNFSFASEERLMQYLGIIPGAVSPLALINDRGNEVSFILDQGILEHEIVHFHPLDNSMTTSLKRADFQRFLELVNHPATLFDVGAVMEQGS